MVQFKGRWATCKAQFIFMKKYISELIRRIKFSIRYNSSEVLIYGFYDTENSDYWREKWDRSRIQYAIDNPWVMQYDFGHKELIEKYLRYKDII